MSATPTMTEREEIAACPFCAGRSEMFCAEYPGQGESWFVFCNECEAEGPAAAHRDQALQKWNSRRPEGEAGPSAYIKRWSDKPGTPRDRVRVDLSPRIEAWMHDCQVEPLYTHPSPSISADHLPGIGNMIGARPSPVRDGLVTPGDIAWLEAARDANDCGDHNARIDRILSALAARPKEAGR